MKTKMSKWVVFTRVIHGCRANLSRPWRAIRTGPCEGLVGSAGSLSCFTSSPSEKENKMRGEMFQK